MLKTKIVTLADGRQIKVNELAPLQLMDLLPDDEEKKSDDEDGATLSTREQIDTLLMDVCGLSGKELLALRPSELEKIWEAFREVNGFFFTVARWTGLDRKLGEIIGTLADSLSTTFADLLRPGMLEQALMAGPSSRQPLEPTEPSTGTE